MLSFRLSHVTGSHYSSGGLDEMNSATRELKTIQRE
jgi:hypothetical protein